MSEPNAFHYPASLQQARGRAREVAGSLARTRVTNPSIHLHLEAIDLFVACVSDDWRRGVVTDTEAAAAIHRCLDRYLLQRT